MHSDLTIGRSCVLLYPTKASFCCETEQITHSNAVKCLSSPCATQQKITAPTTITLKRGAENDTGFIKKKKNKNHCQSTAGLLFLILLGL